MMIYFTSLFCIFTYFDFQNVPQFLFLFENRKDCEKRHLLAQLEVTRYATTATTAATARTDVSIGEKEMGMIIFQQEIISLKRQSELEIQKRPTD
jgi:hypothetical protein